MEWQRQYKSIVLALLTGFGILLLLVALPRLSSPLARSDGGGRRALGVGGGPTRFFPPQTVVPREPRPLLPTAAGRPLQVELPIDRPRSGRAPDYVAPLESLESKKSGAPTAVHERRRPDTGMPVVDVLSVGSITRPEHLSVQNRTWASHPSVRNFWGFTERDDHDPDCPSKLDAESFARTCRSPMGWEPNAERLRASHFGQASGRVRSDAGWFCAQRRPGRALGWLREIYRDERNIPDLLLVVDDDTSVDVGKAIDFMGRPGFSEGSFVAAPCTFSMGGFKFPFGGFGTFLNGDALRAMTRPIFCDGRDRPTDYATHAPTICANLKMNRIGERDVFEEGDSVFDVFYKYSALRDFCVHSDWMLGYMITFYSGGSLWNVYPRQCREDPCTARSVTCHNQSPKDMMEYHLL